MSTIYLSSENGILSGENGTLQYSDYKGNKTKLIVSKISQIVIIGRTTITSGAFSLLFKNAIDVVFVQKNGKYKGKLIYSEGKNTLLRHKQHSIYDDQAKSTEICRDIVRGKMHNQYLFMQRIARKKANDEVINNHIQEMLRMRSILERAGTIEAIRGIEGDSARLYFDCLGKNIESNWTSFTKRTKNPPLDPVNSVLSFLYTVLANKIGKYIYEEGLDPGIGTLHSLSYGRDSLIYDLLEEYRTPIVDTLTCALFNLRILQPEDFYEEYDEDLISDEIIVEQSGEVFPDAVFLNDSGKSKVLEHLERKLQTVHYYPLLAKGLPYGKIIREQVRHYKQVVGGTMDHYLPLIVT